MWYNYSFYFHFSLFEFVETSDIKQVDFLFFFHSFSFSRLSLPFSLLLKNVKVFDKYWSLRGCCFWYSCHLFRVGRNPLNNIPFSKPWFTLDIGNIDPSNIRQHLLLHLLVKKENITFCCRKFGLILYCRNKRINRKDNFKEPFISIATLESLELPTTINFQLYFTTYTTICS